MTSLPTSPGVVAAEGLVKRFGDTEALRGVDLEIRRAVLGLLGPNGAGKTTAVRSSPPCSTPDAGGPRSRHRRRRRPAGVRAASAWPASTPPSTSASPAARTSSTSVACSTSAAGPQRADELLERFGLADAADRLVETTPAACAAGSTSPPA